MAGGGAELALAPPVTLMVATRVSSTSVQCAVQLPLPSSPPALAKCTHRANTSCGGSTPWGTLRTRYTPPPHRALPSPCPSPPTSPPLSFPLVYPLLPCPPSRPSTHFPPGSPPLPFPLHPPKGTSYNHGHPPHSPYHPAPALATLPTTHLRPRVELHLLFAPLEGPKNGALVLAQSVQRRVRALIQHPRVQLHVQVIWQAKKPPREQPLH